ncbi:MAG: N-6 DNA methylase, partial [Bacilli bacterium]
MNLKKIATQIINSSNNIQDIEKALIFAFCFQIECDYLRSDFLTNYFHGVNNKLVKEIINLLSIHQYRLDIYSLVELFELLIPADESKENGMVYTPTNIKDYILKSTLNTKNPPVTCDPACGCGSFLLSAAEYIHCKYNLTFNEIFESYIFGADIVSHNIEKCKTLFHLLALTYDEIIVSNFNLIVTNSLSYNWGNRKFDCIIGNPPYVRSKNLSAETKNSLKKWKTSKTGNVDLYIPFYELGISLLNKNGRLGYISPNTFLQSINGRNLRNFFKENKYQLSVLDFRETQIFKNVTSYTCIVIINKSAKDHVIRYALLNGKASLDDYNFTEYSYSLFKENSPWRMSKKEIDDIIYKIENIGIKLDNYKIRNGLATLKNDIFFFLPSSNDEKYYYRYYNGTEYKIEKEICIDVAKPNIIKNEVELSEKIEKGIYPYIYIDGKSILIDENIMKSKYPHAYSFLLSVKSELDARDKGKGNYQKWYAYGRTQGLQNFGKKLFIPYISGNPVAVICNDPNVLFYCGYAVFSDDRNELIILKKILESDVFWYYIENTSKPYSKGYMSFAKNYIKNFGIPLLT